MKIVFTRHGETVWNTEKRMQGRNDSPLTERGREQAGQLKRRLDLIAFDAVYTSPLGRALDTTGILTEGRNLPVHQDIRLAEIDLGELEGMTFKELAISSPEILNDMKNRPEAFSPPGGESNHDVLERVTAFLSDLLDSGAGCALVVAHAITLRAMRLAISGRPMSEININADTPGCCYCEARYQDDWTLTSFGEMWHAQAGFDGQTFYHGSPATLTGISEGSTITPYPDLARAFARRPTMLGIGDSGDITHDGREQGRLYRVVGAVAGDMVQHPRTTMPLTSEFLTLRDLTVKFIEEC